MCWKDPFFFECLRMDRDCFEEKDDSFGVRIYVRACAYAYMSVCICCKSIIGLLFLKRKWRQYTCIKHRSSMSFFLISSPSRDSKITSKWKFLWIRDSFALCAYHSQLLCYNLYRFLFTHWILFYHSANTWNHKID